MYQYHQALQNIYQNGNDRGDRTGTGSRSLFGSINMEFDLTVNGYPVLPLLSTKFVSLHSIKHESIWMLSGDTNVQYLIENRVKIWNEWVIKGTEKYRTLSMQERLHLVTKEQTAPYTDLQVGIVDGMSKDAMTELYTNKLDSLGVAKTALASGELGPVYGAMWRNWQDTRIINPSDWELNKIDYEARGFKGVGVVAIDHEYSGYAIHRELDQIKILEARLRNNPECRRLILTAWNVARLDEMALPPCHTLAQWYTEVVDGETVLHCKLYQRSADFFLGVPFNIVQYSLLTHMLAKIQGYKAGKLYHTIGDAHIYMNHFDQVRELLGRQINKENFPVLKLHATDINGDDYTSVTQFTGGDISVTGYEYQESIKAPIAV